MVITAPVITNLCILIRVPLSTGSNPASRGNWYSSTSSVTLDPFSEWTQIRFDLTADAMSPSQGGGAVELEGVLANVTHLRLLSTTSISNRGDQVVSTLDVDDITAVPEPSAGLLVGLGLAGLGVVGRKRREERPTA